MFTTAYWNNTEHAKSGKSQYEPSKEQWNAAILLSRLNAVANQFEMRMTHDVDHSKTADQLEEIEDMRFSMKTRVSSGPETKDFLERQLWNVIERLEDCASSSSKCTTKLYCDCQMPLFESDTPARHPWCFDIGDVLMQRGFEDFLVFRIRQQQDRLAEIQRKQGNNSDVPLMGGDAEILGVEDAYRGLGAFFKSFIISQPPSFDAFLKAWRNMWASPSFKPAFRDQMKSLKDAAWHRALEDYHTRESGHQANLAKRATMKLRRRLKKPAPPRPKGDEESKK